MGFIFSCGVTKTREANQYSFIWQCRQHCFNVLQKKSETEKKRSFFLCSGSCLLHVITLKQRVYYIMWAASSEFVSSRIPSWQILTAHAQPFRGARDLAFCLKVLLDSLLIWASSEGSGETERMRRLAWTFAACIGDKDQIRLTRPMCSVI